MRKTHMLLCLPLLVICRSTWSHSVPHSGWDRLLAQSKVAKPMTREMGSQRNCTIFLHLKDGALVSIKMIVNTWTGEQASGSQQWAFKSLFLE
jgi:hypothetical protein